MQTYHLESNRRSLEGRPMLPRTRLYLCGFLIVVSAVYAVLVAEDPDVAEAVALGYIALVLTLFFLITVWKRA